MELSFTDEQRAIAELATSIFGDFESDERRRATDASGNGFDDELWKALADAGLADLLAPDSGLEMVEAMLVFEAQGRHASRAPLADAMLGTAAVARFGAATPGTNDTRPVPYVLALDPEQSTLQARRSGGGWHVSGGLTAVANAGHARGVIAPAITDGGNRLFSLPLGGGGIIEDMGALTDGTPVANLRFDTTDLDASVALAVEAADWLVPRYVAALAALQLGVADEALRRTAAYVSERHQFGRPIGSFQAVAVRAADAYCDVEALRAMVWRLCSALDVSTATVGDIEAAKVWAADCGHRVSHTAQHLHGGLGADRSYGIHRFYLRSRALEMTLGGSLAHRSRLGAWLAADADPASVFVDA